MSRRWQLPRGECDSRSSSALLPFFWGSSPTKIDCKKKGTLILTSLLEDLGNKCPGVPSDISLLSSLLPAATRRLLGINAQLGIGFEGQWSTFCGEGKQVNSQRYKLLGHRSLEGLRPPIGFLSQVTLTTSCVSL